MSNSFELNTNPLRALRTLRLIKNKTADDAKNAEVHGDSAGVKAVPESFELSACSAVN